MEIKRTYTQQMDADIAALCARVDKEDEEAALEAENAARIEESKADGTFWMDFTELENDAEKREIADKADKEELKRRLIE